MIVQVPLRHVKHDLCTRRGSVCLVVRREPPDHNSGSTASRSVSASFVNLRSWSGLSPIKSNATDSVRSLAGPLLSAPGSSDLGRTPRAFP
jgi:hypothetical protein